MVYELIQAHLLQQRTLAGGVAQLSSEWLLGELDCCGEEPRKCERIDEVLPRARKEYADLVDIYYHGQ
eukprot:SAG31_NODE_1367_length_8615_cov_12.875763_12_plen_68_part_00